MLCDEKWMCVWHVSVLCVSVSVMNECEKWNFVEDKFRWNLFFNFRYALFCLFVRWAINWKLESWTDCFLRRIIDKNYAISFCDMPNGKMIITKYIAGSGIWHLLEFKMCLAARRCSKTLWHIHPVLTFTTGNFTSKRFRWLRSLSLKYNTLWLW